MEINLRRANPVLGQKLRDPDVIPVLFAFEAVLHQDDRLLGRTSEPGRTCGRIRLFRSARCRSRRRRAAGNGCAFGEGEARFSSNVDVAMCPADLLLSADDTTNQLASGSNLCTRPQNCVLQDCLDADLTIFSHDRATANPGGRIDHRVRMNCPGPICFFRQIWTPITARNDAMDFEIFRARSNVEPFSFVDDDATDFSAFRIHLANTGMNEIFCPAEDAGRWTRSKLRCLRNRTRPECRGGSRYPRLGCPATRLSDRKSGMTQPERHIIFQIDMLSDQGLDRQSVRTSPL